MGKDLNSPSERDEGKKLNQKNNAETALTLLGVSKFQMETVKQFRGEDYLEKNGYEIIKRLNRYNFPITKAESSNPGSNFDQFLQKDLVAVHDHQDIYESLEVELNYFKEKGSEFQTAYEAVARKLGLNQSDQLSDAMRFIRNNSPIIELLPTLQKQLKDSVIVDIFSWWTLAPKEYSDPKAVLYVNKFGSPDESVEEWYRYALTQDALLFLCLLPDNSVNVSMNGVDYFIISNLGKSQKEYLQWLKNEIYRTLKQEWVFVACSNDFVGVNEDGIAKGLAEGMKQIFYDKVAEKRVFQKKSA